ncbi:hypothetical protein AVEN_8964-1 [Araneus ventricosus]|uniref:Uncharacterized protein n=1 Tax=Araneus ventricosus TaxID=182803 RepID=A0A4Y2RN44_ARAVE|nr:hypothetical protein AVEN_8964-1 [Araneus ventricosus]
MGTVKLGIHLYSIPFHLSQDCTTGARHSSVLHSIPFVPGLFFSIHSSRKMGHAIHGCSKMRFQTRLKAAEFYPLLYPYTEDFEFHFYPRREVSMSSDPLM